MKLEINTNGAWRTVLRHLDEAQTKEAMECAAAMSRLQLAASGGGIQRRQRLAWRIVSEADGAVVAWCSESAKWQEA